MFSLALYFIHALQNATQRKQKITLQTEDKSRANRFECRHDFQL